MITRQKSPDVKIERKILTAMIMYDDFIRQAMQFYRPDCLAVGYIKIIMSWCIEYYDEFKKAPKQYIEDIFKQKSKQLPDAQIDLISDFLLELSNEYENSTPINVDYLLKQAESHFRLISLDNVRVALGKDIIAGRIDEGELRLKDYLRPSRIETQGVDTMSDPEAIKKAFDKKNLDGLFMLPGDLGFEIGPLKRQWLFGVVAASGVGKSWWLWYIGQLAYMTGLKVLFVSFEMSEYQMMIRQYQFLTGRVLPRHADTQFHYPVFDCLKHQENLCTKSEEIDDKERPCTVCRGRSDFDPAAFMRPITRQGINIATALKAQSSMNYGPTRRYGEYKMVQFPAQKITIQQLENYLSNLEYYENFVPDVIISDYPDKMTSTQQQYRHKINEIWEWHKGIAQEKNVLMIAASQSNTARTGKDIDQGSWSEDIRKLHLIDAGFSINQRQGDKRKGIFRCGVMKLREDEFSLSSKVIVLNCLKIGRPYLDSCKIIN